MTLMVAPAPEFQRHPRKPGPRPPKPPPSISPAEARATSASTARVGRTPTLSIPPRATLGMSPPA
ncbi:hypothetical protein HaLaN_12785 [Haematococcus lacustris]|uniref:Uncharacterized protein n=1 Tax=Haematococcus lacustris TaxID=44745 RepID=A0A699ZAV0_HAELA|nr:hypothetical protein HaLaN_12785 [Haematococcus lacustris]